MRNTRLALCIGLSSFAFLSVAQVEPSPIPYPHSWPKLVQGNACQSLSGKYVYRGDVDRRDREGLPTIDRAAFNRMSIRGFPEAAIFDHDTKSGALSVRLEGRDLSPPDRIQFSRELTCEEGWSINLRQLGNCKDLKSPPYDCRQVRIHYTKAEDGSLVVHFTTLAVSKKLLAEPERFIVDAWYRFEPTERQ